MQQFCNITPTVHVMNNAFPLKIWFHFKAKDEHIFIIVIGI